MRRLSQLSRHRHGSERKKNQRPSHWSPPTRLGINQPPALPGVHDFRHCTEYLLHWEHSCLQPANAHRTLIMAGCLSPFSLLYLRAAFLGILPMSPMFPTPPMSVEKISRRHFIDQRGPIRMQAISIGRCIPQVQFPTHRKSLICGFKTSLMLAKQYTSLC